MAQQQMANPIELYEAVSQGFAQAIRGVAADQMSNATPCTEWNVQALLNHNINVTGTFQSLLTAGPRANALELSGPLPPEGPLAAFEAGAARVLEAAKTPGVAFCTECASPYAPKRRPKRGQDNFCPRCRDARVPQRLHMRRKRAVRAATAATSDSSLNG